MKLKSILNNVCLFGFVAMFFAMLCFVAYTRYANIDMTETRLFFSYWKEYAAIAAIYISLAYGYAVTK